MLPSRELFAVHGNQKSLKIQHNMCNVFGLQNINPLSSIYVHVSTALGLVITNDVAFLWFEFGQPSAIELKQVE